MLGIMHPASSGTGKNKGDSIQRTASTGYAYHSATASSDTWAEEDPWDSASDSEVPRASTLSTLRVMTSSKPVPMSRQTSTRSATTGNHDSNSSTSTLAFSYTHLSAPDPSSYPPKRELETGRSGVGRGETLPEEPQPIRPDISPLGRGKEADLRLSQDPSSSDGAPKQGWTIVRGRSVERRKNKVQNQALDSIRPEAVDIVNDPLTGIRNPRRRIAPSPKPTTPPTTFTTSRSHSPLANADPRTSSSLKKSHERQQSTEKLMRERSIRSNRKHKFIECLSSRDINMNELRKLAWAGIPQELRPMAWQVLLGYLPLASDSRVTTLARKRSEYQSMCEATFARGREGLDQQIWHQIEIDVPRTRPGVQLWMFETTQRPLSYQCLERILYVWAIRHPASGYVQGINDLATPFFQVFLSAYIDADPESFDPGLLPKSVVDAIEADSFWCLSKLLDGIQDNYIFAQPGIQRSVRRMQELVERIDAPLAAHLESQNVEFMQFSFRWMNCLLMREISVQNTIRMWDTYLGIIMFLQSLPTQDWGDHEIEMLLSEAFLLNSIWHNAQSHFGGK
ncbi:tbc1 domain family protein [Coprinopsis cinerea okayama7|uniref:Tbc1 domain family protein n=1 Tax=Coprinopsis cinerea (strain Okayama-7 / 130 / ATCC MYA-4618 / FGSC 9003) TaxID=240176 RepID=D6RLC4_COPC7|nr:tbc1 domain family protein [Coprinopsis cinerea okayama7\|eukprot:XP_002911645.1 tbc1 domain family protein [Coprinopsis cinerea okayama7\